MLTVTHRRPVVGWRVALDADVVVPERAVPGGAVGDVDVKHLRWLRERFGDHLLDAVVITTGRHAYRRTDGIAVVPATLLGA